MKPLKSIFCSEVNDENERIYPILKHDFKGKSTNDMIFLGIHNFYYYICPLFSLYFLRMKQTTVIIKVLMSIFLIPFISGCVDDQRDLHQEPVKIPKDQYFGFDLKQSLTVNIDYCFKEDYVVLFEIYDQDPIEVNEEDGSWNKKDIEPFYRASTDKRGKFNGEITMVSDISEAWLYSEYIGTASPIKFTIGDDRTISFNQDQYIQSKLNAASTVRSRGITANNHKYLDDWTVITGVDWNDNGRPNNLSPEKNIPPASVLYSIKSVFAKNNGQNITDYHPEFFEGKMTSDLQITKKTKVSLIFVSSTENWHNTVGYYTYPTGETPKVDNITKIIAFPNASPIYKTRGIGALACGDEVQLKYWNDRTNKFEEEFPEGTSIGWCLQGMGFQTSPQGDIAKGMGIRYSTTDLNQAGSDGIKRQRTVALRDANSNQIVAIGFEDNKDFDYRDAIFYIHIAEKDAIDEDVLPALPEVTETPTDEENYVSYAGTLLFEDLWPEEGDYDMNDVMIGYSSKVYKSIVTNRVYKVVDEFTPLHRGGYLVNGFGYQLHNISYSDIGKVTIDAPSYAEKSKYMNGGNTEAGQSHPTILLFDDMSRFDKKEDKKFTVTIQVNDVSEKSIVPPYNPFIFIGADKTRGKEVHLVKYPPTDKMDTSFLGTGKDDSRPEEGLYFVSKDLMPFALNMPVANFPIPEEDQRIDVSYPKFATWVSSNGKQDKNWYKYPKK